VCLVAAAVLFGGEAMQPPASMQQEDERMAQQEDERAAQQEATQQLARARWQEGSAVRGQH
jgi:hypothetical protein